MHRQFCEPYSIGEITQGSIFFGAISGSIVANKALGVVISARCDIKNAKDALYAYVPAIPVADWIGKYALPKAREELYENKIEEYKKCIVDGGFSEGLFNFFSLEMVHEKLIEEIKDKKIKKKAEDLFGEISDLDGGKITWECLDKEIKLHMTLRKMVSGALTTCVRGGMSGFFFLDMVEDFSLKEKFSSYVVNMREIRYLPHDIIAGLVRGINYDEYKENKNIRESIFLEEEDFGYVLCNVKSPYIELMMQRFSMLFSRIGIDDPDINYILGNCGVLI